MTKIVKQEWNGSEWVAREYDEPEFPPDEPEVKLPEAPPIIPDPPVGDPHTHE